ncbi:MAG: acetyltransferase [Candidatus Omnitrophota bacterium]
MNNGLEKIILIGGGGHCRVIIEAVKKRRQYAIEGIIDPNLDTGEKISGVPVIGNDDSLKEIYISGVRNAFIAVGSIGDCSLRLRLYKQIKETGFSLPVIMHPSAVVAEDCVIEEGVFIAAGAVINPGTSIGKCAIINTSASVDHDCRIGDFAHIAPKAALNGAVTIKKYTHIGSGTVVNQQITIGENCLIGSGSVVVKDIQDNSKALGNPCRIRE